MEEAEKQDSHPEVISPEAEIQQEASQQSTEQKEVHPEETGWIKDLRQKYKETSRQLEEVRNRNKVQEELLQRFISQPAAQHPVQAPVEEDLIHELAKEEYVPGEKVAKALKRQQEEFKREIAEVKQTHASQKQNSLITDLKREFSDFDDVVNPETIAMLDQTNPRLANAIASSKDPYLMAVQAYEYIKAKGLSNKPAVSKRAQETDAKIEQNKKTVQSPQAFEKRPMAQAFQMTDAMKKEIANEMYHYANQAGMGY